MNPFTFPKQLPGQVVQLLPAVVSDQKDSLSSFPDSCLAFLYTCVDESSVSLWRLTEELPGQVYQLPLYTYVAESGVSSGRLFK